MLMGVLVCAAIASAACAPGMTAPRSGELVAESEALAEKTENGAFREFEAALKECREHFTVDRALEAVNAPPPDRFDPYPGYATFDLKEYYAAKAYARSDIGICDKLAVVPLHESRQRDDWAQLCRIHYEKFLSVVSLLHGSSDYLTICRKNVEWSGRGLSKEEIDAACGAYLRVFESHGDAESVCGMEILSRAGPKMQRSCAAEFRALRGDDSRCADSSHGETTCRGVARYARAFARGDPSQCGDSTVCWTLFGDEEKTEDYAARIETSYCRQRPSVATASQGIRTAAAQGLGLLSRAGAGSIANEDGSRTDRVEQRWRQMLNAIVLESKTEKP
jgi:hypothetical protein